MSASSLEVRTDQELSPFSEASICPKCSNADVGSLYVEGCGDPKCSWHAEHIRRTCKRCGYAWPEGVLSSG